MRNFLNQDLRDKQKKIDNIASIVNDIINSYKTTYHYIGNDLGRVKFNGVTELKIEVNTITLTGYSLINCLDARTFKCDTGSMIGRIEFKYDDINDDLFKWIVNNLARYEKIFPL